jgi:hypothetical protein
MKSNNVITPIQKVLLFQYQNKTYFEKCIFWIQYYLQWVYYWLVSFGDYLKNQLLQLLEQSQTHDWGVKGKQWLENMGVWDTIVYYTSNNYGSNYSKTKRARAANDMLEFIEVQYDNWEAKVEKKMTLENRKSFMKVEEEEEIEKGNWGSENIEEGYYDKDSFEKTYTLMLLNPDNDEEKEWKRKVMIVFVPMIGNIIMYYDIFRMSFAYYSDTQGIHYNILNACAMRYVSMFHCMDLFMDEMVGLRFLNDKNKLSDESKVIKEDGKKEDGKKVIEYWKSPLRWINKMVEQFHLENEEKEEGGGHRGIYGTSQKKKDEGKGIKLEKEEREKLFAKLKQYRTEYVPEKEIKLRNRFIYKGRTRDSCHSVFAKKVPEVKVVPAKVSMDMKSSFFSGLLPLKLPTKFWEVEEQEILDSNLVVEGEENEVKGEERGGEERGGGEEKTSYLEYKKKLGIQ